MLRQYLLFTALCLLFVADAYTTIRVIREGGYESNKALSSLDQWLHKVGFKARWLWLVVVKILSMALCGWVLLWYALTNLQLAAFVALLVLYVWVVRHNYRELRG